jgi:hypothetical protein
MISIVFYRIILVAIVRIDCREEEWGQVDLGKGTVMVARAESGSGQESIRRGSKKWLVPAYSSMKMMGLEDKIKLAFVLNS